MSNPWTPDEDQTISEMWIADKPTAEIALVLPGRNRNMVIGRARRLGLPLRPSPIKMAGVDAYNEMRRKQSVGHQVMLAYQAQETKDLGALSDQFNIGVEQVKSALWRRGVQTSGAIQPRIINRVPKAIRVVRRGVEFYRKPVVRHEPPKPVPINEGQGVSHQELTPKHCQYPISEDRPWRFCGCERIPGKPYCLGHQAITYRAYVPAEKPREFILEDRRAA